MNVQIRWARVKTHLDQMGQHAGYDVECYSLAGGGYKLESTYKTMEVAIGVVKKWFEMGGQT